MHKRKETVEEGISEVEEREDDRSDAVNKRRSARADNNAINISAERSTFSICAMDNDAVAGERIG